MGRLRKEMEEAIDDTAWKIIEGYYWPYRVHESGAVERLWSNSKWRPVKSYVTKKPGKTCGILTVHMRLLDGRRTIVPVKNLVIDAFLGGRKPGDIYTHRNRMTSDCSVHNLVKTTKVDVAKRTGGGMRKTVEKIDRNGNVVDLYSSVTEAAKRDFIDRRSVQLRCANKIKGDPFELTGFSYRYER